MTHAELAYAHADRAVYHWTLILAGSLSPAQRRHARIELIRAIGQRVRTRMVLEQKEVANEVGVAA